ncbi:DUF58 domain-containing protein [Alkalinema pantanalense CENA528]|uniref:DUF58 domain-containing protein n=1 Tax=Alkalinema pantanalense TaxID=1620705 RepID=UPI003D6E8222
MIPTLRVYGLLILGVAITTLLALLWPGQAGLGLALLLLLLYDFAVLGAVVIDGLRSRSQRVEVMRQPISRLSIGRDNPITLTVRAKNREAIVQIRDAYPQSHFTISQDTLEARLAPQESQDLTYQAKPTYRGSYNWGKIAVRQLSNWKLVWLDWTVAESTPVEVFPDLIGLRSLSIRLALQATGSIRQNRRMGMGTEFAELRDYATGDDPRLIDWKATARRDRPLVRVLEPEQEQTLIILLDRGRLMTAQVNGLQRFDWGLNATLSLALTALKRGDRVGVGVFDRALHTWIPPQRGDRQLMQLLEQLTPIQPDFIEPDYLGTINTITQQQHRRALIVVITDIVDDIASMELLNAMGRLAPRYLPFCVALRDSEIDRQAHTFSIEVAENYARAVALDLINQRQVAFAKLKQKGVLVLDAPADQITDQLIDRYLQLKLRNQL